MNTSLSTLSIDFSVNDHEEGQRADVVLGQRIQGLSRRQARKLSLQGQLRINGKKAAPSQRLRSGDRVQMEIPDTPLDDPNQTETSLNILRESEDFIYVLKPPGMHTVALKPQERGCLSTLVAKQFPECVDASTDPREAGAVHRLDRLTSGVVVFARKREVWEQARIAFSESEVDKQYLAILELGEKSPADPLESREPSLRGWLEPYETMPLPELKQSIPLSEDIQSYRIRAAIGRGPDRQHMAVRLDGQRATTRVQFLAYNTSDVGAQLPRCLCQLALDSGRRHQARLHMAWISRPIVGDPLYGEIGDNTGGRPHASRLRLHAFSIDLSKTFPKEERVLAQPESEFFDGFFS